jgi:putative membrane protein
LTKDAMSQETNSPVGARAPRVFDADDPAVVASAPPLAQADRDADADSAADDGDAAPGTGLPPGRGFGWFGMLVSAALALMTLAAGVWFTRFVSVALARDDWVGWTAFGLACAVGLAAFVLLARELIGFFRLRRLVGIRRDADRVHRSPDRKLEVATVRRLRAMLASARGRSWDMSRYREEERHMRAPGELIALADRVLLSAPDKEARRVVYQSAKRLAVASAIIPYPLIMTVYALIENVRMIRRIAGVYGGQPGVIGGLRLLWRIVAHIAAIGIVAFTDDFFGHFLGQDLLHRLSRRAGESFANAALTARLGCAALAICRPLPFIVAKPIRARAILAELMPALSPTELIKGRLTKSAPRQPTGAGSAGDI